MKKGTLNKIGKGWQIVSAEGKSISVMGDFKLTDDMTGKEIEFDNTGGPVQKIVLAGKTYQKAQVAPVQNQSRPNQNYNQRNQPSRPNQYSHTNVSPQNTTPRRDESRQAASAPYNFVSLNQTVVPSDAQANDFSVYEGLSGYIDVTVTTQTPMFIRGIKEDFFKIGEEMAIPGSSFRGLIRTMVEMMSYSKLNSIDADKRLFMRFVAAFRSDFKEQYANRLGMSTEGEERSYEAKAGFLHFNNITKNYYVRPASYGVLKQQGLNRKFQRHEDPSNRFCEIYTGLMGGKKAYYKFFYPSENTKRIVVDDDVIKDYREDKDRKVPNNFNALEACKNNLKGFPIFFTSKMVKDEEGKDHEVIDSFGHTKYYRLPYLKRMGELRPQSHIVKKLREKEGYILDFAESIFGVIDEKNQVERTGKVYFEDLKCQHVQTYPPRKTQILGSPKPTSFQLYLEQSHGEKTQKGNLTHWDTPNAQIRGNKNYWHRITSNDANQPYSWVKSNAQNSNERDGSISNQDAIKAIKEGSIFKGRIRFDNLTAEELGALMCALNLPEGCCHKIGMGKPLGLGSIKTTAVLTFIDRKERYNQLFEENNWYEATAKSSKDFRAVFQIHILSKLAGTPDAQDAKDFWNLPRMKELRKIITFDTQKHGDNSWLEKTRYQTLDEFKQRSVLPKPDELK